MTPDIPVIDYQTADSMTKRKLQMIMWLSRYGIYDSTAPLLRLPKVKPAEVAKDE